MVFFLSGCTCNWQWRCILWHLMLPINILVLYHWFAVYYLKMQSYCNRVLLSAGSCGLIILRYLSIVQNHKWLLVQRQSSTFCSSKLGSYYACAIRWSQNSQLLFVLCSTAFSRESLVVIVISLEIILSVISINSRIF